MKLYRLLAILTTLTLLISAIGITSAGAGTPPTGMDVRQVTRGGTTSAQTGAFTQWKIGTGYTAETPPNGFDGKSPSKPRPETNRSLSNGNGPAGPAVSSRPEGGGGGNNFKASFDGLTFFQQRWARGGNQFSVEPPDQGLCAGNGYVVEAVNDVVNVYNTSGQSVLPANSVGGAVDLNSWFGYSAAIDRNASPTVFGPSLTDPTCVYDAASNRFFLIVLTLDTDPASGGLTLGNHIDMAVSSSGDPTKPWYVYPMDVMNDGSNKAGAGNDCPCLGDYPHIGLDANGVYVSTNAYPWNGSGFDGAQIYAYPKAALVAGNTTVNVLHIDTWNRVEAPSDAGRDQPGFTVWPAQAPAGAYNTANGGTQYFVSSNAADEATHPVNGTGGTYTSNKLVVWTLKNTSALNTVNPFAVNFSNKLTSVGAYSLPPKAKQPGTGSLPSKSSPLGYCVNDTKSALNPGIFGLGAKGCWQAVLYSQPTVTELIPYLDSNDTRIQQVEYANGYLWTTLDTSVTPSGNTPRAGLEWFMIKPETAKTTNQGYLGATGMDFTYPSIGVTTSGKGIISFTATGDKTNPSAAYATVNGSNGITGWTYAKTGAAPDDGFSGYYNTSGSIRPRWGDYGATAVDGNNIWFASEYIATACDYKTWAGYYLDNGSSATPGICGGSRAFYGNWATRVSMYQP